MPIKKCHKQLMQHCISRYNQLKINTRIIVTFHLILINIKKNQSIKEFILNNAKIVLKSQIYYINTISDLIIFLLHYICFT